jgi:hypothetical protein
MNYKGSCLLQDAVSVLDCVENQEKYQLAYYAYGMLNKPHIVRFEVFTAVTMKKDVFWVHMA